MGGKRQAQRQRRARIPDDADACVHVIEYDAAVAAEEDASAVADDGAKAAVAADKPAAVAADPEVAHRIAPDPTLRRQYCLDGPAEQFESSDSEASAATSAARSVAGDTASEVDSDAGSVAGRERRRRRTEPMDGVKGHHWFRPARQNSDPEVGNFALFFGNWGMRGTLGGTAKQKAQTAASDLQILKSPGQVIVLVEALQGIEKLLQEPPQEGDPDGQGLAGRKTYEHWVIRGKEQSSVLIAARKDTCWSLNLLSWDIHNDHKYKEKKTDKVARTRTLVCNADFRQNVGHLGTNIVVAGVHAHHKTMTREWPTVWHDFWSRLAACVIKYDVRFLAGDFNMSLTEVPKQLRSRGVDVDCAAWYPWQQDTNTQCDYGNQRLGFDSCAIFYTRPRGQSPADVMTPFGFGQISLLAAVAGNDELLDTYGKSNAPGKHWACYRSRKHNEKQDDKDLTARLEDLLKLTSTPDELAAIPKRQGSNYRPYLRLHQKKMELNFWLVDGDIHNGAHFPLCVFTKNFSARSAEGVIARRAKKRAKQMAAKSEGKGRDDRQDNMGRPKGSTSKGKGCAKNAGAAVAEPAPPWLSDKRVNSPSRDWQPEWRDYNPAHTGSGSWYDDTWHSSSERWQSSSADQWTINGPWSDHMAWGLPDGCASSGSSSQPRWINGGRGRE